MNATAKSGFVCLTNLCVVLVCIAGTAAAGETTAFSLRTYAEYDDNVGLVSDDLFAPEPIASAGIGLMLSAAHTFARAHGFELRGGIVGFHTKQLEDAADEFDVTGVIPRVTLSRRLRLGAKPATFTTGASVRRDWLGGAGYSRLIDLSAGLMVNPSAAWSLGPDYSFSHRAYDDDGFDPSLNSRDGQRHTLGLASQILLPSPAGGRAPARLSLRAGAQRNDADGANHEFEGVTGSAQLDLPLLPPRPEAAIGDFALQLAVSGADVDYDEFQGPFKRRERRLTAMVGCTASIARFGRLDFSYTRLEIDSNLAEYDATRGLVRLGFTYTF